MIDINWNAVYDFWLVAEHGSFAEASRRLPRGSIQSLHKKVRRLESAQELDLRLLRSRGMKGMELTEAGRRLYQLLDPVFRNFDSEVSELRGEDAGELAVAITAYATANCLKGILETFRAEFPRVTVKLVTSTSRDIAHLVEARHADFGIGSPAPGASAALHVTARSPMRFELLARSCTLLGRSPLTWTRVLAHPLILLSRGSVVRQALIELLRRRGLLSRLRVACEASDPEIAVEAVRAGFGIALLPSGIRLSEPSSELQRVPVPPGLPTIDISVICRRDQYLSRYRRRFLELAEAAVKDLR
jgi:DNA-binding transcriptional LysR family regulator